MNPIEERLGAELHRLTDGVAASDDPLGDVRRGRRRRTRIRRAAGGGAVVVLASASAVAALVPGEEEVPVAQDPAPTRTAPSSPATSPAGRTPRCVDADGGGPGPGGGRIEAVAPDLLDGYRAVLAAHLDPAGRHLGPAGANQQVGTVADPACRAGLARLSSYGTKLEWRVPGGPGLGMVQVEVTDQPWEEAQLRLAHDSWRPHPVDLPGVRSAEVAAYDGGVAVVVHRADGVSVGLDANTLFGNNSRTPVGDLDVDADELVAAAADPGFRLS